jgi:integrase
LSFSSRKREPVILTVPEVAALADALPERLKAAILVSAWCGVRWGELIELRRKDIEVDVLFVGRVRPIAANAR